MKSKYIIIFLCIILLASFLRVFKLNEIPGSLSPDEAVLGYTSYSFLLTGADEHGKLLPLALQSFGDGKLPGYSYMGILPVALLGLNEFSTRFPSALAGVIGVVLIYQIGFFIFNKKSIALFSSLFFALSPWSIYLSRAAYEVNMATTLFLAGLFFFLKFYHSGQKRVKTLIASFVFFCLAMLTYHSYILFIPIFVLFLFFFMRKEMRINFRVGFIIIFFIIFIITSYAMLFSSGKDKVSTLSIYSDKNVLYNRVEKLRGDSSLKNDILEKFLHNKYLGVTYQLGQNYINTFSPEFLFDKGGEKLQHNLGNFGNLYLFDALLLIMGFAGLFYNRENAIKILCIWLLLGPIPSALTRDSLNSTRLFLLMPAFILVEAYGAYFLYSLLERKVLINWIIKSVLILLFFLNVGFFLDSYFMHFNTQRVRFWHYGYKQAVELSEKYPAYDVVMRGPENFPYIYFLFYMRYDPLKFRKEVSYYPVTSEGFLYVKSFGKYTFPEKISYSELGPKTLSIDDTRLDDKKNSIYLPSGEPVLGYWINN